MAPKVIKDTGAKANKPSKTKKAEIPHKPGTEALAATKDGLAKPSNEETSMKALEHGKDGLAECGNGEACMKALDAAKADMEAADAAKDALAEPGSGQADMEAVDAAKDGLAERGSFEEEASMTALEHAKDCFAEPGSGKAEMEAADAAKDALAEPGSGEADMEAADAVQESVDGSAQAGSDSESDAENAAKSNVEAEKFAEWIRLDGVQPHPTEYFPWLERVLGEGRGKSGLILWELSSSVGIGVGWRELSKETCIDKVSLWSVRPTWGDALSLRQVSTSKFEKYQFVTGHMRAGSLHQYFLWCMKESREPSCWALEMAKDIPLESVESVDAKQAALRGLQASVERQAAATGFTAYSLYCLMMNLKLTPAQFRQSVKQVLPQFCDNQDLFPWKVLEHFSRGRIAHTALQQLAAFTAEYQHADVFPPEWLKHPLFMVQGQRQSGRGHDNISEDQQMLWVSRMMFEIRKKLDEKLQPGATKVEVRKVAPGVVRTMNEEQRLALRQLAISFSMCFKQINFTADERKGLFENFARGEADLGIKHNPNAPQVWSCVRAVLKERKAAADLAEKEAAQQLVQDAKQQLQLHRETQVSSVTEKRDKELHLFKTTRRSIWLEQREHIEELAAAGRKQVQELVEGQAIQLKEEVKASFDILKSKSWTIPAEAVCRMGDFENQVTICDLNAFASTPTLPKVVEEMLSSAGSTEGSHLVIILPSLTSSVHPWEQEVLACLQAVEKPKKKVFFVDQKDPAQVLQVIHVGPAETTMKAVCAISFEAGPRLQSESRHDVSSGHSFHSSMWRSLLENLFPSGPKATCHILELPCGTSSLMQFLLDEGNKRYVWTGVCGAFESRAVALQRILDVKFEKSPEQHALKDDPSLQPLKKRGQDILKQLTKSKPPGKRAVSPTLTGLLVDASSNPFPEQAASRKALVRLMSSAQRIDAMIPDEVVLLEQCLQNSICVSPSLQHNGLGVWPAQDFECGQEVFTVKGKFQPASAGAETGILVQFAMNGRINTSLVLPMIVSRDFFLHLHLLDGEAECIPAGLTPLECVWSFSTFNDPVLTFRATEKVLAWSSEFAVYFKRQVKRKGGTPAHGSDKPHIEALTGAEERRTFQDGNAERGIDEPDKALDAAKDGIAEHGSDKPCVKAFSSAKDFFAERGNGEAHMEALDAAKDGHAERGNDEPDKALDAAKDGIAERGKGKPHMETLDAAKDSDSDSGGDMEREDAFKDAFLGDSKKREPDGLEAGPNKKQKVESTFDFNVTGGNIWATLKSGRKREIPRTTVVCKMAGGDISTEPSETSIEILMANNTKVSLLTGNETGDIVSLKNLMEREACKGLAVEGKGRKHLHFTPKDIHMPFAKAYVKALPVMLVWVLKQEEQKLMIQGCMLVLKQAVKIPKGQTQVNLSCFGQPNNAEDDE